MDSSKNNPYPKIYGVVAKIPCGRVATYGEVAIRAGLPNHARTVGYALHALRSGTDLPWHRVINAQGRISLGSVPGEADLQRALLEAEGVGFDETGRVDLALFGWGSAFDERTRVSRRQSGKGIVDR